jgi:hypothetical protein
MSLKSLQRGLCALSCWGKIVYFLSQKRAEPKCKCQMQMWRFVFVSLFLLQPTDFFFLYIVSDIFILLIYNIFSRMERRILPIKWLWISVFLPGGKSHGIFSIVHFSSKALFSVNEVLLDYSHTHSFTNDCGFLHVLVAKLSCCHRSMAQKA